MSPFGRRTVSKIKLFIIIIVIIIILLLLLPLQIVKSLTLELDEYTTLHCPDSAGSPRGLASPGYAASIALIASTSADFLFFLSLRGLNLLSSRRDWWGGRSAQRRQEEQERKRWTEGRVAIVRIISRSGRCREKRERHIMV